MEVNWMKNYFPCPSINTNIYIQLSIPVKKQTHIHAPTNSGYVWLAGVLANGRVRCPWHGACFNVKNGDIEEFPGLDSVPSYKVTSLLVVLNTSLWCLS